MSENVNWKPFRILALCSALACMAAPACARQAQTSPGPAEMKFVEMDSNRDGKVVLEEFRTAFPNMSEQAFAVIDADNSGAIERAEWADFIESHARGRMPGRMKGESAMPGRMNNMPGDPMIPPPDSNDLPLVRPPEMN